MITRLRSPRPTRAKMAAKEADQKRWNPISNYQIEYNKLDGSREIKDITSITTKIENCIDKDYFLPVFEAFLKQTVKQAVHFLFSTRSLMAIHTMFIEDWMGTVTPLPCDAEELSDAFDFLIGALEYLSGTLFISCAPTIGMAYSTVDFSEQTLTGSSIFIHRYVSKLVNHATLGSQVMYVVLISICHEFIHLLVAYKYGKSLTPKLKGVEMFKVKTRNRSTGVSEPGFVYEQLVVGPLTIAVCSNKNKLDTILCFGLDFFDQDNNVNSIIAPPNGWFEKFLNGCKANVYMDRPPENSKDLLTDPDIGPYVQQSRFRTVCSDSERSNDSFIRH